MFQPSTAQIDALKDGFEGLACPLETIDNENPPQPLADYEGKSQTHNNLEAEILKAKELAMRFSIGYSTVREYGKYNAPVLGFNINTQENEKWIPLTDDEGKPIKPYRFIRSDRS